MMGWHIVFSCMKTVLNYQRLPKELIVKKLCLVLVVISVGNYVPKVLQKNQYIRYI